MNCSDLEQSLRFYRDLLGFTPIVHTTADPQPGSALGLGGEVAWDAWILCDRRWLDGVAVDLLEWKTPSRLHRRRHRADPRASEHERRPLRIAALPSS